jgi:hypothetical protein
LPELTDPNRSEEGQLRLFTPDINKAGPPWLGKIHFDGEGGEFSQFANCLEAGPAKANAILHVSKVGKRSGILAVEPIIQLKEPAEPNEWQFFTVMLQSIQPSHQIANLIGIEHGIAFIPETVDPLPRTQVDVARLIRSENGLIGGGRRLRCRDLFGCKLQGFKPLASDHTLRQVVLGLERDSLPAIGHKQTGSADCQQQSP